MLKSTLFGGLSYLQKLFNNLKTVCFSDFCMKSKNVQRQILSRNTDVFKNFMLLKFFNTIEKLLEKHCFDEKSTCAAVCRGSHCARNVAEISRIPLMCGLSTGNHRNCPKKHLKPQNFGQNPHFSKKNDDFHAFLRKIMRQKSAFFGPKSLKYS